MEISPVLIEAIFPEGLFEVTPAPAIILDQPWTRITTAERALLEKILAAIRQSVNSVTMKHQDSLDLARWSDKPRHVIYFGNPVKGVPLYEMIEADGVTIVASESLSQLSTNEDARKKLWQALKKQFSV